MKTKFTAMLVLSVVLIAGSAIEATTITYNDYEYLSSNWDQFADFPNDTYTEEGFDFTISNRWNGGIRINSAPQTIDGTNMMYFGSTSTKIYMESQSDTVFSLTSMDIINYGSSAFTATIYKDYGLTTQELVGTYDLSGGELVTDLTLNITDATNVTFTGMQSGAIDNLEITPEPATMALLGLGGLMIRRRHKA
jgi:hypothetical protein